LRLHTHKILLFCDVSDGYTRVLSEYHVHVLRYLRGGTLENTIANGTCPDSVTMKLVQKEIKW